MAESSLLMPERPEPSPKRLKPTTDNRKISDDEFYNDGMHEITDEELKRYKEQVDETDGFDVEPLYDVFAFGIIQPEDLDSQEAYNDAVHLSKLAVDEYNRRAKGINAKLEFVRVVKCMSQVVSIFRKYITFEAMDMYDESKIKSYQAVVMQGVQGDVVESFRLKPTEGEQGNGKQQWFWESHLCPGKREMLGVYTSLG